MRKLIIILIPFFTTVIFTNAQTIVSDTNYYVNPSGGWYKTVTYKNAETTTTATVTRVTDSAAALRTSINQKQNTITLGTTAQYLRGDLSLSTFPTTTAPFANSTNKNFVTDAQATVIGNTSGTNTGDNATNTQYSGLAAQKLNTNGDGSALTGLTKAQIGLGNADNTSDANKPVSSATQTALNLKANLTSPTFTGTVNGITSAMVGAQPLNTNLTSIGGLANANGFLKNNGSGTFTYENPAGAGTVTSTSVVSANGFAGSVANPTTTPAITISTSITGIIKGNGTAISAAVAGTDYLAPNGSGSALTGITRQYTLSVQALTSSPTDAQTIFFGNLPKAPVTAAATSKIYIRQSGTIRRAEIYCYSGTAGTAEAWVMSIRLNNTTDTQIASVSLGTSERIFSNTGLSIAVVAGDYIEIKCTNPTWATNPLTTIMAGYIVIETTN